MELITMIISGLALLAATADLFLHWREKKRNEKRNEKRNAAMVDYIGAERQAAVAEAAKYTDAAIKERIDPVMDKVESIGEDLMNANGKFQDQLGQTLSNIMNFDPMESYRKARQQAMGLGVDD